MKSQFLLDPDVIFLNHGSFGATPRPVFDAYRDWQRKLEIQPVLFLGRELQGYLEQARTSLGLYLNANPNNLVYVPNATFGVNIIARSLTLSRGDEILITNHEYGASERTWRFICQKTGASLIRQDISLPVKDDGELIDQLWRGVTQRTKLIFISHISSPTALTFPVEKICARARQNGILTMIDGAHAPGQIPVDLQAIGTDFYTGNCHKWMMAPKGSAFLYVHPDRQSSVEPLVVSWGWEAESTFTTGSQFLDYLQNWGTRDPAACLSVPTAIQFQIDYNWDDIRARCHEMVTYVIHQMTDFTGLNNIYPSSGGLYHQMAALQLPDDVDVLLVKKYLYDIARIEIPCYLWEELPYIRISIQGYNSFDDINHFLSAIRAYLYQEKGKNALMNIHSYISGMNHWLLEPDLPHILSQYWQDYENHLEELVSFGELVGCRAYELADYIDHFAPPTLVMHDINGIRIDRARLCPQHEELLIDLASMNRPPYHGSSWIHHFALGFLLADPGLYCTLIVTNQTAYAIYKYAPEYNHWVEPLLSGAMWGATWMTETQGGSDLGANTTTARREIGGWRLYGEDKYFASNAGIADLAIITARPEGAAPSPKGLALFLVPRETPEGKLNYKIRRFKNKSATRAVPTGEVELHGSLAYLIGEEHLGIYYTLENLTVSRLANAVGASGLARKAHLEALFRTQARSAFGKPLMEHPLVRYDLTDLAVRTAGSLALVFHAIQAWDNAWQQRPPYNLDYHYARFLSHLVKNRTAYHAAESTRLAIDLFGGLGVMEEYSVYRLHREALVTAIWEGTSNIQALDLLETVEKKSAHEPFLDEFNTLLDRYNTKPAQQAKEVIFQTFSKSNKRSRDQNQWYAKDGLNRLADAAQVALLYKLSEEGGERYAKLAELYATRFLSAQPYPHWALEDPTLWHPGK